MRQARSLRCPHRDGPWPEREPGAQVASAGIGTIARTSSIAFLHRTAAGRATCASQLAASRGCAHRTAPRPVGHQGSLARVCRSRMRGVAARVAAVIRIDAVWLATAPLDMRCGTDTALSRVVQVFGAAKPHHAYLFANRRATRMKVLVHDGIGIWLCARRLHQGRFAWGADALGTHAGLASEQLQALVLGLPWQRLGEHGAITLA